MNIPLINVVVKNCFESEGDFFVSNGYTTSLLSSFHLASVYLVVR